MRSSPLIAELLRTGKQFMCDQPVLVGKEVPENEYVLYCTRVERHQSSIRAIKNQNQSATMISPTCS